MVTKNDVTGDSIQSKTPSKEYRENYETIFGKDQKRKQKAYTELNWDGNENRGRYGEDEEALKDNYK
tara:strand:+ start:4807 stop:5007 length:201 start_codon:yes stop_codon:yes gene_type:complete